MQVVHILEYTFYRKFSLFLLYLTLRVLLYLVICIHVELSKVTKELQYRA